jgi:hypothetical protein
MRKISILFIAAVFTLGAFAAYAADLTIDEQVNTVATDNAASYLSFKGAIATIQKDQFDPALKRGEGADAVTGASKQMSTEVFNAYRLDVKGKKTIPFGVRGLFLYPVAGDTRANDNLTVTKAADGVILVRYIHRGTAYEFATDKTGKLALPTTGVKMRTIGTTDNKIIGSDFGSSVKDVSWAKVWDSSVPDGKQLGTTKATTGKILADDANSDIYVWGGFLQLSFDGKILKVTGALDAQKK